jgi:hypothetical protein
MPDNSIRYRHVAPRPIAGAAATAMPKISRSGLEQ